MTERGIKIKYGKRQTKRKKGERSSEKRERNKNRGNRQPNRDKDKDRHKEIQKLSDINRERTREGERIILVQCHQHIQTYTNNLARF
jgi:hypothetical protein